jgi:8-oxo-dGTP diphosphatase
MNSLTKEQVTQIEQEVISQGYELAVDCFIINDQNQVFAQKRSMDRRLYPGCWDFPGGHVDPGDSLYNTIFKEVKEELNLEVDQILYLFDKVEWIIPDNSLRSGENPKKMILQFVITVKTMEGLKLEEGKAVDWKWIDESNLEILKEGRPDGEEDIYTYDSVKKLLESL